MRTSSIHFKDASLFLNRGLINVSDTIFQRRNLLIGKNGSGKTRFLNALYDVLLSQKPKEKTVVRLDFSTFHISGRQGLPSSASDLYSILISEESANFFEFLGLAEEKNQDFIRDIKTSQFDMRAAKIRQKAEEGLNGINIHLKELIGYEIYFGDAPEHLPIIRKVDTKGTLIREKPYSEMISEFSPGERFIFYLSFFLLYMNTARHEKLILLLDEPELHLHPHVLIKVIRWLYDSKSVDELWVATHSLFLVPLFLFEEIALFENNCILSRNSIMYKQLYNELVGLEEVDMFEMLKSMDNWEYYRFITECFCLPTTVNKIDSKDEQFKKFANKININTSDVPLQVLDYGAGEFRIWECMQMAKECGELDIDKIAYEAYEPHPKKDTIKKIERNYGKDAFPIYTDIKMVPTQSYDAVILMNVLHEIDILEWEKTFQDIQHLLSPSGILIFLEVQTLSLGEQPFGNTGYLILGPNEIKKLFKHPIELEANVGEHDKTHCWAIPNHILASVDSSSILDCLNALIDSSKRTLNEQFLKRIDLAHNERTLPTSDISARKYAFWSQQYINAILALDRFNVKPIPIETSYPPSKKIDFPGLV